MKTSDVLDELFSFFEFMDTGPLERALAGNASGYEVDGETVFSTDRVRIDPPHAFDSELLWMGAVAFPFLALRLPVGDPVRARLPALYAAMLKRLENPKLRLPAGPLELFPPGWSADPCAVVHRDFVYFSPALVDTEAQRAALRAASVILYRRSSYPWSGSMPALEAFTSAGYQALIARIDDTPLPAGTWEADPRASVPRLVFEARERHGLSEESATLLLQVLTLADRTDSFLCDVNGWTPTQLEAAADPLLARELLHRHDGVLVSSRLLHFSEFPQVDLEDEKLDLYDAFVDTRLVTPLGRALPLLPLHELFEAAWRAHREQRPSLPPAAIRPDTTTLSAIREDLDDDAARLVFADSLLERGEPLGEFIRVQCELARAPTPALERRERELLRRHQGRWLHDVSVFIGEARWSRGFVTAISVPAITFARVSTRLLEAMPLIESLRLSAPLSSVEDATFAACPELSRVRELDLLHAPAGGLQSVLKLLESPHLLRLRVFRVAPESRGFGMGPPLLAALVACRTVADSLEELDVHGQNLGIGLLDPRRPLSEGVERRGIEPLVQSLRAMPRLKTLRVPQNGYDEDDARGVLRALKSGVAPALRVLDFRNRTKGSLPKETLNRVSEETQQAIEVVLARRA